MAPPVGSERYIHQPLFFSFFAPFLRHMRRADIGQKAACDQYSSGHCFQGLSIGFVFILSAHESQAFGERQHYKVNMSSADAKYYVEMCFFVDVLVVIFVTLNVSDVLIMMVTPPNTVNEPITEPAYQPTRRPLN
ncbi:hypothetical protein BaRGS_00024862 [Batillaria attramentaria]|uniref:Uncharacterized protein n=1 Tax=Batillaria attramentaria TaxID=370345 RepID=A0ABD0KA62_9CAEN